MCLQTEMWTGLWQDTTALEDFQRSEDSCYDTLKMEAARSTKTMVSYCNTTKHHNPEFLDLSCTLFLTHEFLS